jgi:hypothetical protein
LGWISGAAASRAQPVDLAVKLLAERLERLRRHQLIAQSVEDHRFERFEPDKRSIDTSVFAGRP